MNNKIKKLVAGGIITLSMLGCKTMVSEAMSYMYTTENVNLRQYAGTYSRKLGVIKKGTKIPVYGSYGNWYRVLVNGKWGYVCKDYINSNSINKNIVNNKGQILNKLIIVNKDSLKVAYYENGRLIRSFKCAIGKASTPTPNGSFKIINKQINRPYYKKGIRGGAKNNPLGSRFLQLTSNGYALHGTCYPNSIGTRASDGCVRLVNSNIEWLFDEVPLGTRVLIGNGYNKNIASMYGYKIY